MASGAASGAAATEADARPRLQSLPISASSESDAFVEPSLVNAPSEAGSVMVNKGCGGGSAAASNAATSSGTDTACVREGGSTHVGSSLWSVPSKSASGTVCGVSGAGKASSNAPAAASGAAPISVSG